MSFGRLERTQGSQPMSEINMTPLIDVMLVLVVVFIITAPLLTSAIKVDLPKAEGTQSAETPRFVALTITPDGKIYLNDEAMDVATLAGALNQTAQSNRDTEVQLRADETVPYGKVVEVMGLAQKAGLNRIGFVAQEATPPRSTAARVAAP
jgi:biopolymer transport protein TolR